jgi:hypothetical protein
MLGHQILHLFPTSVYLNEMDDAFRRHLDKYVFQSSKPQNGCRIAVVGDVSLYIKPGTENMGFESGRPAIDYMRKI